MAKKYGSIPESERVMLVALVQRIMDAEGSEEEQDAQIQKLEDEVLHPEAADLIFYPEVDGESAEKIVDKLLAYRPISG
jgi:hypothetical protein